MNNKGQTLIIFILLIPILAIMFIYAFKQINMVNDNKEKNGFITSNMIIILNNDIRDIDKIKSVFGDNSTINIAEDKIVIRVDDLIYCGDYLTKTYQKGGC